VFPSNGQGLPSCNPIFLDAYPLSTFPQYFPEDDTEDTGIGGAQVDERGAFAFQTDLAAPQGGFSFNGMST